MKRNFYALIAVLAMMAVPNLIWGQRTISGTVTDAETGEPLIGANILIQPGFGTATDIDGTFSVEIPEEVKQIEVTYTRYATQMIELGASNIFEIQLRVGTLLDEVVIIGYGTVKRQDLTGSVQTVDSKVFNKGNINSPQQLLAGKIAGCSGYFQ